MAHVFSPIQDLTFLLWSTWQGCFFFTYQLWLSEPSFGMVSLRDPNSKVGQVSLTQPFKIIHRKLWCTFKGDKKCGQQKPKSFNGIDSGHVFFRSSILMIGSTYYLFDLPKVVIVSESNEYIRIPFPVKIKTSHFNGTFLIKHCIKRCLFVKPCKEDVASFIHCFKRPHQGSGEEKTS